MRAAQRSSDPAAAVRDIRRGGIELAIGQAERCDAEVGWGGLEECAHVEADGARAGRSGRRFRGVTGMFGVAALATRIVRRPRQLHDPALVAGQNRAVPDGDDREQEDAKRAGVHVRAASVAMGVSRRQCCVARTTLRLAAVARIVDYEHVLKRMQADGFRSLYHNSGAFGFARGADVKYAGWVGSADASIRAEARAFLRQIAPPYEANLSRGAGEVWTKHLPGP